MPDEIPRDPLHDHIANTLDRAARVAAGAVLAPGFTDTERASVAGLTRDLWRETATARGWSYAAGESPARRLDTITKAYSVLANRRCTELVAALDTVRQAMALLTSPT